MALEHTEVAKKFYNSSAWRKCREAYLNETNWVCERCGSASVIVHHKTYIDATNVNDPSVTLNFDNLEGLCYTCHNQEHFEVENHVREGLAFNMYGELIKLKD